MTFDITAFAQAFTEHEQKVHGADNPEPIPATCLEDTKTRYEALREAQRHEPGDPHTYEITCTVCGGRGTVMLIVEPQTAPEAPDEEAHRHGLDDGGPRGA